MSKCPNTNIDCTYLSPDVVLCCGEDQNELEHAIRLTFGRAKRVHSYRCYSVYRVGPITFVWTGIGTGCLEPLLCELFTIPTILRMILVGTAGATGRSALTYGSASAILKARVACAGITPNRRTLLPNWKKIPDTLQTASILSTDYYYGFSASQGWPSEPLRKADRRLEKAVLALLNFADLIDMETGQFYHLCRILRPSLQYIALKGPANSIVDFREQSKNSQSVLINALVKARDLFSDPLVNNARANPKPYGSIES